MKTLGVVVGLIVLLLVLASPWTVGPAATQQPLSLPSIRAWALINFEAVDTVGQAARLWTDANYLNTPEERWKKISEVSARPKAAILSISVVRGVGKIDTRSRSKSGVLGTWDAIALIRAADQTALELVEQYIEANYSHVDMYRIDERQ